MKDLFMTVNEVADCLGVNAKTIYKWSKTIPGYIKIGGNVLFNRQTFLNGTKGLQSKPAEKSSYAGDDRHNLT
ncbi:MAG: helix-turn-helix domain-containing protein [Pseudomonadota bacterium]